MPYLPAVTQRFDTYLQVRLTTHDKERIKARAVEAGLKTSEYVRRRVLSGLEAETSTVLGGETTYGGHCHVAVRRVRAEELERNIRGSVGMQAPRNEP